MLRRLELLVQEQEKAVKDDLFHIYRGLCMQEAFLLKETAKDIEQEEIRETLLEAAVDAMRRAMEVRGNN